MQLLILAHTLDGGAHAVAALLAPALGERLRMLRPEWLGQARWSQRLDPRGVARTRVLWHGGQGSDGSDIGLVWNRIRLLPQAAFRASTAQDRDYAGAELHALVASWLAELGDGVEPAMRRHCGVTPMLHYLRWMAAAGRCGLALATGPPAPEDFSVLRTPLELCAPGAHDWPAPFARACHALAGELGFALLQLGFRGTPAAPLLCRVDAHPALQAAGEARAVARWLSQRLGTPASADEQNLAEAVA